MTRITLATALLLAFALPLTAQRTDDRSLDEVVETALSRAFAPGGVVAIVVRDSIAFLRAYGRTALDEAAPPLAADALFRAGALAEVLNALAAMQLAQLGAIDLDAPVGTAMSELPRELRDVTTAQLLSHTAGLAYAIAVPGRGGPDDLGAAARGLTTLDRVAAGGVFYSFSNPGLALAGLAIERAAKQPYAAAMRQLVLEPLGMTRSTFEFDAVRDSLTPGWRASNTVDALALPVPALRDSAARVPVRGFFTTARDAARLAAVLLSDGIAEGERVLPPGIAATLLQPRAEVPFSNEHATLGVRIGTRGTSPVVSMVGGANGHTVSMRLLPRERLGVVVLTNSSAGGYGGIAEFVFDRLVRSENRAAEPESTPPDTAALLRLAEQTGRYLNGSELIEIVEQDGLPLLKSGDLLLPIRPQRNGAFVALIDDRPALRFRLLTDDTGRIYLWLGDRALGREAVR